MKIPIIILNLRSLCNMDLWLFWIFHFYKSLKSNVYKTTFSNLQVNFLVSSGPQLLLNWAGRCTFLQYDSRYQNTIWEEVQQTVHLSSTFILKVLHCVAGFWGRKGVLKEIIFFQFSCIIKYEILIFWNEWSRIPYKIYWLKLYWA